MRLEGQTGLHAEVVTIKAVVDGDKVALVTGLARADRWQMLQAKVLDATRLYVGNHVPRLRAHDPGKRLSGYYKSRWTPKHDEMWIQIHSNGYLSKWRSYNALAADIEAQAQVDPTSVYRYTIRGGALEAVALKGDRSFKLEVGANHVQMAGIAYAKMGRFADGTAFDGTWQYRAYIERRSGGLDIYHTYKFTADGRFVYTSFRESVMEILSDGVVPPAGGYVGSLYNSHEGGGRGHYRVARDKLQLRFEDGSHQQWVVLGDKTILFIAGRDYSRQ